jgi:hypothetical protein
MTVHTAEIITRFREFCGDTQYRKFLRAATTQSPHRGPLRYWQEQLWQEYCAADEEATSLSLEDVRLNFQRCYVHDLPLLAGHVPAVYGDWRFPREYLLALENEFPFAKLMYCGDSVVKQRHANRKVSYCPACRDALVAWNNGRKQPFGIPPT